MQENSVCRAVVRMTLYIETQFLAYTKCDIRIGVCYDCWEYLTGRAHPHNRASIVWMSGSISMGIHMTGWVKKYI
jgi:hypothetical protein